MKIAVLGYSGSGKSWLTANLSKRYGIPALGLDDIAFDKHWRRFDDALILPQLREFMAQDSWVIDGNYNTLLLEERLEQADRIILVNLPRLQCLVRALKRSKERTAQGYVNDINPWFLRFLLFDCRNKARRAFYRNISRNYAGKVVLLKSQRQIDHFLARDIILN